MEEFKRGQWVLCRDEADQAWSPYIFCKFLEETENGEPYLMFGGNTYRQCIPLEGSEELIGKKGGPEPEKPEIAHYEFLERVEVYDDDKKKWEPGVYVKSDGDYDYPHKVLLVEDRVDRWHRDKDVRRAVRAE